MGAVVIALYASFIIFTLIMLVYLVIKRIQNRDKEDFEQRDN